MYKWRKKDILFEGIVDVSSVSKFRRFVNVSATKYDIIIELEVDSCSCDVFTTVDDLMYPIDVVVSSSIADELPDIAVIDAREISFLAGFPKDISVELSIKNNSVYATAFYVGSSKFIADNPRYVGRACSCMDDDTNKVFVFRNDTFRILAKMAVSKYDIYVGRLKCTEEYLAENFIVFSVNTYRYVRGLMYIDQ